MGVGLESGLAIDAIAEELGALVDRADAASLTGEVDELSDALAGLAEHLLYMRPFIPDKRNALPADWRRILGQWVSGAEIHDIGPNNMRVVEEAFTYRLVWALEAIRTRRLSLGWSPDIVPGGGAAALETGVPRLMMSILIRAGLPSRRAAMAAIESTNPVFVSPPEMRAWLESDEITAFTDLGDWPTPDTAALWARFRTEALSGGIQTWNVEGSRRLLNDYCRRGCAPAGPLPDHHRCRRRTYSVGDSRLSTAGDVQKARGRSKAEPVHRQDSGTNNIGRRVADRPRQDEMESVPRDRIPVIGVEVGLLGF
jgi:hypothetical protein